MIDTQTAMTPMGNARLQSEGSTEKVVAEIRQLIREKGLRIGDILPSEAAVGAQLGVSRTVVREAFRSMAALKLIDVGNGRRARVAAMGDSALALVIDHAVHTDQISVQQILDVRRTVEMRTVSLAALRRTDQEAEQIVHLASAMRRDFDRPELVMEHDIAFHETIAKASRNPMFALMVGSFDLITRETWGVGWAARSSDEGRYESVSCHEAIAAAVRKRDQRECQKLMAAHFDETVKVLLAAGIN